MLIVPVMAAPVGALPAGPSASTLSAPSTTAGDAAERTQDTPWDASADDPARPRLPDGLAARLEDRARLTHAPGDEPAEPWRDRFGALIDEDGMTDSRAWIRTVRAFLAETTGAEMPPIPGMSAVEASTSSSSVVASHFRGTDRVGVPAGDLDGDGRADTLSWEIDLSTFAWGVRALDADGDELWNRTYPTSEDVYFVQPIAAGDLDGDGGDDVMVLVLTLGDFDGEGECVGALVVVACAFGGTFDFAWRFEMVEGAVGQDLWVRDVPGTISDTTGYASTVGAIGYADAIVAENIAVAIFFVEGPDGRDVLLETLDLTRVFALAFGGAVVAFVFAYDFRYLFEMDYAVLDGATGDAQLSGTLGPGLYVPFVLPAGDLTGDGTADLFRIEPQFVNTPVACVFAVVGACAFTYRGPAMRTSAQDGASGDVLWERVLVDTSALFQWGMVLGDHDGDGADDLMTIAYGDDGTLRLRPVDGTDGTRLWDARSDGILPIALGDADGDGADDVLMIGLAESSSAAAPAFHIDGFTFEALSGADGERIYDRAVRFDAGGGFLFLVLFAGGDLDADGATDWLPGAIIFGSTGDGYTVNSSWAAFAGGTGEVLWERTSDDLVEVAVPGGPIDATAGTDVLFISETEDGCSETSTIQAANGLTADPLWSLTEETVPFAGLWGEPAGGTYDDHPAGDVLVEAFTFEGGEVRANLRGVAGPSGDELWRFGPELHRAVCVPLVQDDAGSGGDAGDNATDALEIAPGDYNGTLDPPFDDEEDWYAFELAAGDPISVDMDPDAADFDLALVDPDGDVLDWSTRGGDAAEHVEATAAQDGTHYVRVFVFFGKGNYSLSVEAPEPEVPEDPPTFEPRVETLNFTGDINCAVALSGVLVTNDLCDGLGAEAPPNGHSFPVGFDPGATSVHVEVHWDDDAATLGADRLLYFWSGYTGELEDAEGTSPIVHDQALGPGTSWYLTGRNGTLGVQVSQDATGPLVVDQPFTVCVAIMYGGADLPADFACEA